MLQTICICAERYSEILGRIKHSESLSCCLVHRIKNRNREKCKMKLIIVVEVLCEVTVTFPNKKGFFDQKLEQKCAREIISLDG